MLELAPAVYSLTYDEAVMYCFFLEHNGYRDWRMPTMYEFLFTLSLPDSYDIWVWYIGRDSIVSSPSTRHTLIPVRTVC